MDFIKKTVAATIATEVIQKEMATGSWGFRNSCNPAMSPIGQGRMQFVQEISQVVHQIERAVLDTAHQIPEEVAEGIDRPANRDDEAHGVERGFHVLVHALVAGSHGTSFTNFVSLSLLFGYQEDFEEAGISKA